MNRDCISILLEKEGRAGVYIRINEKTEWHDLGVWGSEEAQKNYLRLCMDFHTGKLHAEPPSD